jgi:hypothetical protein
MPALISKTILFVTLCAILLPPSHPSRLAAQPFLCQIRAFIHQKPIESTNREDFSEPVVQNIAIRGGYLGLRETFHARGKGNTCQVMIFAAASATLES